MDIEKNTIKEESTQVRKNMMEWLGTKNFEEYLRNLELIAWWYMFSLKNGYRISSVRQITPIQEEELELPINLII